MLRLLGITGLQAMPTLAINSTLHIETLCLEHNSTRPIALMSIIGCSALDFTVGRKVAAYPCVGSDACLAVSQTATSYSLDQSSSALTVKRQRTGNDSTE